MTGLLVVTDLYTLANVSSSVCPYFLQSPVAPTAPTAASTKKSPTKETYYFAKRLIFLSILYGGHPIMV